MSKQQTETADRLIKDSEVRAEFGDLSEDALKAWDKDPNLGFPPKITIRNRHYRSRAALDAFKAKLLADAMRNRKKRA